jgi:serine/threonine protein kinase
MEKYKQYFKNAHRINDALYKTKVDGVKYIIKYFKLHDSEMFYEAIRENAIHPKLIHPNIIRVHDQFVYDSRAYMVLPYIKNSLFDLIKEHVHQHTKFTDDQVVKIITGILRGLYYMHENSVYHRDLKPENVMIMSDFTPIIIDFGSCKEFTMRNTTGISTDSYRAPEIVGAMTNKYTKMYDEKVDVWGVGCILYELLTNLELTSAYDDEDSDDDDALKQYDDSAIYANNTDTEEDTETEDDTETDDDTDIDSDDDAYDTEIIKTLFRKLGVPSNHVLDTYNLGQFVDTTMDRNKKSIDFLKSSTTNNNMLMLLIDSLNYDPKKRCSIKYALEMYCSGQCPSVTRLRKDTTIIKMNNLSVNMGNYESEYKRLYSKLHKTGMSKDTLQKSKKLGMMYMSRYKHRIPNNYLPTILCVAAYMCDMLSGRAELMMEDCIDLLDVKESRFNKIVEDMFQKTYMDVFLM